MPKKRLIQAVNDALSEEMDRDPRVILFGEDVKISIFGDTRGLFAKFGPDRVLDTPICEATLTGMAVGAAAAGYRIVLHMMFANFVYTGFDAIANQMAKMRLMTGGQINLPVTVMVGYGAGRSLAAQHSDTPYPALMNLGGVNVVVPSTPADAAGLLRAAVRNDNPTFFLEPGGRGAERGEVPEGEHVVPLGKAAIRRAGDDVTLVSVGGMMKPTLEAADELAAAGIEAEVIDCRTLVPLDTETIKQSIAKTGRLVVVDEARDRCSAASHIAAVIADEAFESLRGPIKRVTVPNIAMPYASNAEKTLLPQPERIAAATTALIGS